MAYALGELLHEGAETLVYRGRADDGSAVALKLPRDPSDARALARLRREHALLRGLAVPGVVRALDLVQLAEGPALVLEDLGGSTLHERLREGPLPPARALAVGAALAEALAEVHARGVVHRDVKPRNVALGPGDAEVRLLDFGAAVRPGEEPGEAAAAAGTLAYMSPEQTGRTGRAVDRRADLYGLGATLHEALTGAPPFAGADAMELVHSHLARAPAAVHELRPEVPAAVSAIVARLLAKAPEDRYQDAGELALDLRECLERLGRGESLAGFEPGRHGGGASLRPARRLYGRGGELAALLAALARVRGGASECVVLAGDAGVGKSALLDALRRSDAAEPAQFAGERWDDVATPLAALARLLGDLVRQILGEPAAELARWRGRILAAVGPQVPVLVGLVPALGRIVGAQGPAVEVDPGLAQDRLAFALDDLLAVLAAERPLVLLVDDAHALDGASARLLARLLAGAPRRSILVVFALRPAELAEDHPLALALAELRRGPVPVHAWRLAPLAEGDLAGLLAEVTGDEPAALLPLARVVRGRTGGNPLFVEQFLRAAREAGHLRWRAGRWEADLAALAGAEVTANVAELMAAELERLSPGTRRALELAACVGSTFELAALAELRGETSAATREALRPALREGLVAPAGEALRFAHERVRRAAYDRLDADRRRALHLQVGRRLLARGEPDDAGLFEVVDHLRRGAALLRDPGERRRVVGLLLRAGLRARAATDHEAAHELLVAAEALLSGAEEERARAFEVRLQLAECEGLCGRADAAERRFAALLAGGGSPGELGRVYTGLAVLRSASGRFVEALAAGRGGLSLLGIDLPGEPAAVVEALARERAEVDARLAGRSLDALVDAPALADPEVELALKILVSLGAAAYFVDRRVFQLVVVTRVRLGLRRGHTGLSPYCYATYALILAEGGQHAQARGFFDLALALGDRIGSPEFACKLLGVVGLGLHFSRPLRDKLPYLRRAEEAGRAAGDLIYLSYARYNVVLTRLGLGDELVEVAAEVASGRALTARTRNALAAAMVASAGHLVAGLVGEGGPTDEPAAPPAFAACWHHGARIILGYLTGDLAAALAAIGPAEAGREHVAGQHFAAEVMFFACLALYAADAPARAARAGLLATYREELARLAAIAPQNFRHMDLLLAAEEARARGEDGPARERFDESVDAALAAGLRHHAAIASERAAEHYLALGRPRLARVYLAEAHQGYLRWGAVAVARRLRERHPDLRHEPEREADEARRPRSSSSSSEGRPSLDLISVIKASQAFAQELDLDALLRKVMQIVVENAGASRGLLLLEAEGELQVMAAHDAGGAADPGGEGLARSVAYAAHRTGEPVVLAEAAGDPRFARDPHVRARAPRSILCVPIVHQQKGLGVLYLENNLGAGAFTRERVDVLMLLGAQVAISIEQTRLFARLEAARAAAEAANMTKSAFLANMSHELRTPLNAIIGYSELLTELAADAGATGLLPDLQRIRGAGRHLLAVISDILDISRIEAGVLALADERFAVQDVVDEVVAALAHQIARGGNALVLDAAGSLGELRGDPTRLRQVLFNLLSNAAKFTERGTITLRVRRQPGPDGAEGWLWFSVADTGIGIAADMLAQIFQAFVQADSSSTRRRDGTGLGLTISRHLCHLMGGEIRVESEPGRGSTFTVTLPPRRPAA